MGIYTRKSFQHEEWYRVSLQRKKDVSSQRKKTALSSPVDGLKFYDNGVFAVSIPAALSRVGKERHFLKGLRVNNLIPTSKGSPSSQCWLSNRGEKYERFWGRLLLSYFPVTAGFSWRVMGMLRSNAGVLVGAVMESTPSGDKAEVIAAGSTPLGIV